MDSEFGNWFAGFVDGDGSLCFITAHKRPRLTIQLSVADELVLHEIRGTLGFGTISHGPGRSHAKSAYRSRATVSYYVDDLFDCLKVTRILDRCPLRTPLKKAAYVVWRQRVYELVDQRAALRKAPTALDMPRRLV